LTFGIRAIRVTAGRAVVVLDGDRDDRLALGAAAALARPRRTDVGLVDLDGAGEQLAAGQHHRAAQLVQPRPRGLVAAESEHALQAERADALLLVDDVPDRREPALQRQSAAVEDRPGGHRRLVPAQRAAAQPATDRPPVAADGAAEAAPEPLAPADALEVAQARLIIGEPGRQLVKAAWVVDSGLRRVGGHVATL
jgi:hypothetical protein